MIGAPLAVEKGATDWGPMSGPGTTLNRKCLTRAKPLQLIEVPRSGAEKLQNLVPAKKLA